MIRSERLAVRLEQRWKHWESPKVLGWPGLRKPPTSRLKRFYGHISGLSEAVTRNWQNVPWQVPATPRRATFAVGLLIVTLGLIASGGINQNDRLKVEKAELESLLIQARGAGVGQWADAEDLLATYTTGKLAPLDDAQAVAAITLRILRTPIPVKQPDGVYKATQASYPQAHRIADAIVVAARAEELPAWLLARTVEHESRYNAAAVGPENTTGDLARGLGQVMPRTWVGKCPGVESMIDLYVPERNARCSAFILKEYLTLAEGDVKRALLMYNRGPGAVVSDERNGYPTDNGYPGGVLARTD